MQGSAAMAGISLLVLLAAAGVAADQEAPAPSLAMWEVAGTAVGRVMSRFGGAPAFWSSIFAEALAKLELQWLARQVYQRLALYGAGPPEVRTLDAPPSPASSGPATATQVSMWSPSAGLPVLSALGQLGASLATRNRTFQILKR